MLFLLARRVASSSHTSTATYTRNLQSSVSALRSRRILDNCLHTNTVQSFANSHRNASTKAVAKVTKAKPATTGRKKSVRELTPEQKAAQKEVLRAKNELDKRKKAEKAAALRAQQKAQLEKKKAAAALQRRRLVEKNKKLAQKAKAEKEKAKAMIIKPPPRRLSPFALFVKESGRSATAIAADWHSLSEERKQDYAARAKVILEKREEEFNTFMKSVTPEEIRRYNRHQKIKGGRRIRSKSEPNPSRLQSVWMRFIREYRARPDQAGKLSKEIVKDAGKAWSTLTQEEKDKYKFLPAGSPTA